MKTPTESLTETIASQLENETWAELDKAIDLHQPDDCKAIELDDDFPFGNDKQRLFFSFTYRSGTEWSRDGANPIWTIDSLVIDAPLTISVDSLGKLVAQQVQSFIDSAK